MTDITKRLRCHIEGQLRLILTKPGSSANEAFTQHPKFCVGKGPKVCSKSCSDEGSNQSINRAQIKPGLERRSGLYLSPSLISVTIPLRWAPSRTLYCERRSFMPAPADIIPRGQ